MNYNKMIEIAKSWGLADEANYSYGICLMAIGSDTPEAKEQAAEQALREWDIE